MKKFLMAPMVLPTWWCMLSSIGFGVFSGQWIGDRIKSWQFDQQMKSCIAEAPKPCRIGNASVIVTKRAQ